MQELAESPVAKRAKLDVVSKDRISELPVHIKHLILSKLLNHEAMMTTRLSRAWRDVWIGLPCLDLSESLFLGRVRRRVCSVLKDFTYLQVRRKLYQQFLDFVELALQKRCNGSLRCVQQLDLYMPSGEVTAIDQCMRLAIGEIKVDELKVNAQSGRQWGRVLENVTHSSLKRLSLRGITLVPNIIELLDKSCPLLEKLHFANIGKLGTLLVTGMQNLNELELKWVKASEIVVQVPNLRSLKVLSKGDARIEVTACRCLKRLKIQGCQFRLDQHSHVLESVEKLSLLNVFAEEASEIISSSSLKSLSLLWMRPKGMINIDAPNLMHLKLDEIKSSNIALVHSALKSVKLKYRCARFTGAEIVELLRKFSLCEEVNIMANLKECSIQRAMQKAGNSPSCDIQHLTVIYSGAPIAKFVESLLLLCPRLHTLSVLKGLSRKDLKFVYNDKVYNSKLKKKCCHCQLYRVRCWRHDLRKVTIMSREINDQKSTVKEADDCYESDFEDAHDHERNDDRDADILKALFDNARKRDKILVEFIDFRSR